MNTAAKLLSLDTRFEVRELLGEGGMGAVHLAWDRQLERSVALKFIRGQDASIAERLLLEARLQARVEHANVGKVYEVGEHQGRPCIAMQLIRGKSLDELAPALGLNERVRLLQQVAQATHAAHLTGLVHRDLKPANLMVEDEGAARKAWVTDFGLARGPSPSGLSSAAVPLGTFPFMSPEQVAAKGPIDFRSDVYSLGATLFSLLVLRAPFSSQRKIIEEDPPRPRSIDRSVPRDLETIALRCLDKDPGSRYPSAAALADDLGRYLEGKAIVARPPGLFERAARFLSRHRSAALGAVAVLIAVALAALWNVREAAQAKALQAERESILQRFDQRMIDSIYRLRLAHMAPLHDRTPQLNALKASIAEVTADMARVGPLATGPGNRAIGLGLLALDDYRGAIDHLEQAWALGLRSPDAADALGWALYLWHAQESGHVLFLPPAELKLLKLKLEKIKSRALEVLSTYEGKGETIFSAALRAQFRGDSNAALEALRAQLAAEPWHERALFLIVRIRLRDTAHARTPGEWQRALTEARSAVDQLTQINPSNPVSWHEAWLLDFSASRREIEPAKQRAILLRGLTSARNAAIADPRSPWGVNDSSAALAAVCKMKVELGESPLAEAAEGIAVVERGRQIVPADQLSVLLANSEQLWGLRAIWKLDHDQDPGDDLRGLDANVAEQNQHDTTGLSGERAAELELRIAEALMLAGQDPRPFLEASRLQMQRPSAAGEDWHQSGLAELAALSALVAEEHGAPAEPLFADARAHLAKLPADFDGGGASKAQVIVAFEAARQEQLNQPSRHSARSELASMLKALTAAGPRDALGRYLDKRSRALQLVAQH